MGRALEQAGEPYTPYLYALMLYPDNVREALAKTLSPYSPGKTHSSRPLTTWFRRSVLRSGSTPSTSGSRLWEELETGDSRLRYFSNSSSAPDTSPGRSLGMKCPTPETTRRATSDANTARSAGGDSVDGRAIPSSPPYRVIEGAESSAARRAASTINVKRGSPGALPIRWRYE